MLIAVLCLNLSCDDWIDVDPVTETEAEEFFSTEDGFRNAITGAYSLMSQRGLYGRELTFGTLDVMAGYYTPIQGGSSAYYNFYKNYPYKKDDNPNIACVNIVDGIWKGMYNVIANLNSLLEYIDVNESVFVDDNYRLIKGEAIGLRAFLHLDLLRLYGASYAVNINDIAIPFVESTGSQITPRSSVEVALDRIILELESALLLMENDPIINGETPNSVLASTVAGSGIGLPAYHNRKYRFNFYAVEATLARAYLWKGDKIKALNYALDVIEVQENLFPWVEDNNIITISDPNSDKKDRTFTTEHVFSLNIRDLESYIPFHFTSAYRSSANSNNGLGLFTTEAVRNGIYENDPLDIRSQYLFTLYEEDKYFLTKFYQDERVFASLKNQMPVIRISELFYIAAECDPSIVNGLAYLNEVREARKLAQLTNVASPEELQYEIQKEYQKEFIGEGQLWYYYKRHNFPILPYATFFNNTDHYVFDLPEEEYTIGGRTDD